METTGSQDAADLKADLDTELRLLYNDVKTYELLLAWEKDESLNDIELQRQLNVLIRTFKQNIIPEALVMKIAKKEAELSLSYSNFRPHIDQKSLSENDIREILKKKKSHKSEKKAWEASKEIGGVLAPQILQLVGLRNQAAKHLGYDNFFEMQLDLQEVDGTWLFNTLENLADHSDAAYSTMLNWIEQQQIANFQSVSMS